MATYEDCCEKTVEDMGQKKIDNIFGVGQGIQPNNNDEITIDKYYPNFLNFPNNPNYQDYICKVSEH